MILPAPETSRANFLLANNPVLYEVVVEELRRGTPRNQILQAHPELHPDMLSQILDREGLPAYQERISNQIGAAAERILDRMGVADLDKASIKDLSIAAGILLDHRPSLTEGKPPSVVEHRVLHINLSADLDRIRNLPGKRSKVATSQSEALAPDIQSGVQPSKTLDIEGELMP